MKNFALFLATLCVSSAVFADSQAEFCNDARVKLKEATDQSVRAFRERRVDLELFLTAIAMQNRALEAAEAACAGTKFVDQNVCRDFNASLDEATRQTSAASREGRIDDSTAVSALLMQIDARETVQNFCDFL